MSDEFAAKKRAPETAFNAITNSRARNPPSQAANRTASKIFVATLVSVFGFPACVARPCENAFLLIRRRVIDPATKGRL
jgi:hypothetical protein